MSNRRAKQPLNKAAVQAANKSVGGRKLTMGNADYADRKKWMDAYIAAGGKVDPPCENCTISSIVLLVEKNLLTLKHNHECRLEILVTGTNFSVNEYRIEIKKASGADWCVLSRAALIAPWEAVIAGKFKLRGIINACGGEYRSPEVDVEVQFPSYVDIISDPTAKADMDSQWQLTLNDCTRVPNRRRERGYWIQLNTATDNYEHSVVSLGDFVIPALGATCPAGRIPADNPAEPGVCDGSGNPTHGALYSVAFFHTHTSTEYRKEAYSPEFSRPVGPSEADNNFHTFYDVPGVVYDYIESPAASGSIPMGHPKNSAAQFYHSFGKDRRTTPN